jgi:hypothetical protein
MRSKGSPHEMREQTRREKRERKEQRKLERAAQNPAAADSPTFITKIHDAIVAGADGGQPK